MAELREAASRGIRSLYLRDATFGVDRRHTESLFEAWEGEGLRFEWMCFTRPDLVDEAFARRIAAMGCRLVMLGVESFDDGWLEAVGKGAEAEDGRTAVARLRREGVATAATIMVGMDTAGGHGGADEEGRLLRELLRLGPDYVSLNVYASRPGVTGDHPSFRRIEAERSRYEALAERVNRRFYRHPRTIYRLARGLRSWEQAWTAARMAVDRFRPIPRRGGGD
jgi:radical SAM superfamily enzyme YgiQ (UPF0313 family)